MKDIKDPASLENLHDIVMPEAVSLWWPLAPGWWFLFAVCAIVGLYLSLRWWQRWQANAYRRAALAELEATDAQHLSALLKRTALSVFPRAEVASLSGKDWIAFLNTTTPVPYFKGEVGGVLVRSSYESESIPVDQLADLRISAKQWIAEHRRTAISS